MKLEWGKIEEIKRYQSSVKTSKLNKLQNWAFPSKQITTT